jgi:nuclear pore complex protein Nup98-Nup96
MTRIPELREQLDTMVVPDAADAAEIEELTRSVPKLIQQLPDVFNEISNIRHQAALAEMISGLTTRLDQLRPLAVSINFEVCAFLLTYPPHFSSANNYA